MVDLDMRVPLSCPFLYVREEKKLRAEWRIQKILAVVFRF